MLGLLAACAVAVATPGGSERALLKSLDAARALPPCERCAAGLRAVRTNRSPNVVSLAMRLCRERRATVERLFARTAPEEAAYAALLDARLADGDHEAACAGALEARRAAASASRSLGPVLRACCDAERADLAAPLWDTWRAASNSQKSDDWSLRALHARRQDATRWRRCCAPRARAVALDAESVGALLQLSRIDGEARTLGLPTSSTTRCSTACCSRAAAAAGCWRAPTAPSRSSGLLRSSSPTPSRRAWRRDRGRD